MIREMLEKIIQTWRNLSEREQRLAVLTVIAAALMIVFFTFRRAQERIDDLDREIDILEEQLVSFTGHLGHRDLIEAQYAAIAAQHSSEWTEAEIHDRLRQEIYRLAKNNPPPLDERGIPVDVAAGSGNLVEISMGKGQMTEGGVGYREYRINLRIQPTYLNNIIEFLQRLHNSPQSLRIDALDLNRAPESDVVAASVDISRIVADGAPMRQGAATVASSSGVGRIPLRADSWEASGAMVQDDESASLRAHGAVTINILAAGADVYMRHSLPGGAAYEIIADVTSSAGGVMMGVGRDGDGTLLFPLQPLAGNNAGERYQAQFELPGDGAPVMLRCPWIQAREPGAVVQVSGLLLRTASEMYE